MSIRFSEERLGLIGAQSVRWPDRNTSLFWKSGHEVIAELVGIARSVDQDIDVIERNTDLSATGALKAIGEVALRALDRLVDLPELQTMRSRAEKDIKMFDSKKGELPKADTDADANAVAIAAQIRERIFREQDSLTFACRHKSNPAVVAAIAAAPAFLSGLSDEEKNQFLREAEGVLWPDAVARTRAIQAAMKHIEDTIKQVRKMIAQRGQLLETLGTDGVSRWQLPTIAGAAA
jgi:hypothetical protein